MKEYNTGMHDDYVKKHGLPLYAHTHPCCKQAAGSPACVPSYHIPAIWTKIFVREDGSIATQEPVCKNCIVSGLQPRDLFEGKTTQRLLRHLTSRKHPKQFELAEPQKRRAEKPKSAEQMKKERDRELKRILYAAQEQGTNKVNTARHPSAPAHSQSTRQIATPPRSQSQKTNGLPSSTHVTSTYNVQPAQQSSSSVASSSRSASILKLQPGQSGSSLPSSGQPPRVSTPHPVQQRNSFASSNHSATVPTSHSDRPSSDLPTTAHTSNIPTPHPTQKRSLFGSSSGPSGNSLPQSGQQSNSFGPSSRPSSSTRLPGQQTLSFAPINRPSSAPRTVSAKRKLSSIQSGPSSGAAGPCSRKKGKARVPGF